jgi:ubiquinone/menaquinone biosynthesis C-methylase UbiE
MSDERQPVETTGRWWGKHVHRYNEALFLIKPNDTILDIACGTGFGTVMLAEKTKGKVVGGDIAQDAIDECNARWKMKNENVAFRILDGTNLDFPDNYFDKIVSFETIEHTRQYREMAAEFARVLKPDGMLILSTPNRTVSSPNGIIVNPYHTQEFTYDELREILEVPFSNIKLLGQRYQRYDKRSLKYRIGKFFENMFLSFGICKLPYSWRSGFMKLFFGYPLYPRDVDYVLEQKTDKIRAECPVLFAICQKK